MPRQSSGTRLRYLHFARKFLARSNRRRILKIKDRYGDVTSTSEIFGGNEKSPVAPKPTSNFAV